tara:strand:- start:447 stop:1259 length:813 start_codon:yes stop_codon:yes gene_type:complete
MILAVLGFGTSIYLTYEHFSAGSSVCDFSETVSCSLVNSSVYSELLNVPVAVFGALWMVVMFFAAWHAIKKKELIPGILAWSIAGVAFITYMIIAEILLEALCPFCTVVHVLILIMFGLALYLYKKEGSKLKKKKIIKALKPWIVTIIILNLIPLIVFNLPSSEPDVDYTPLAQCITENGVNMYGSFRCGVCAKTRALFGDAFEEINEIECHPQGENAQTELCLSKGIEGTPTWILEPEGEEVKRQVGFMTLAELQVFAGCEDVQIGGNS